MKNFIIIAVAVTFSFPTCSQIKVLPVEKKELNSKYVSEEAIQKLRNSQTVFFYRADDDLIELRKALEDVWTISELFIFPYSEMNNINLRGKSYFVIEGLSSVTSKYTVVANTYFYLMLYMDLTEKNGKEFRQTFSRIDLFPTAETMIEIPKQKKDQVIDYIYNDAELSNWTPGFLRNYLRNVNNLMDKGEGRGLYKGEDEVPMISQLANKTLFIPDYTLVTNRYGREGQKDAESLMKDYPYAYEFKSSAEISNMILAGEDIYYLVYTKSSTEKYFTVFHSSSGEIVFNAYKPMSYALNRSDFKDIGKSIKKMIKR